MVLVCITLYHNLAIKLLFQLLPKPKLQSESIAFLLSKKEVEIMDLKLLAGNLTYLQLKQPPKVTGYVKAIQYFVMLQRSCYVSAIKCFLFLQEFACISYTPEVCAGLKFVSGSRQGGGISAWLPARLLGDFQLLVSAWSRDKNVLSSPGPGPGALLYSPGLSIPAGNPGVPDVKQY